MMPSWFLLNLVTTNSVEFLTPYIVLIRLLNIEFFIRSVGWKPSSSWLSLFLMKKLFQFLSELNGAERKCFNRYEAAYLMISTKVLLITISGTLVTRHLSAKVFAMHPHSLVRELGLIVLPCQFLLLYILPVLRWIPLLQEGREPHCVITGLNSLNSTIQSPIAGEEISEGAFYWIERGTLLIWLALTLLCVPTKGAGKSPTHSIPELFLLALKQR